jgi:putative aldouronate transport system substrate-binding protein
METIVMPQNRTNRRSVLQGGAALGASGLLLKPDFRITFAQEASPAASPAAGTDMVPSGIEGVPDVYLRMPEPYTSYDGVPGNGGTVRAFTISYNPPPPPRDQNRYWQELERRLGVTWEIDMTPQPNYGEKSSVYVAGGDLPDLFYINPGQNASQQYQALAQGAFTDLTPYVTGDALQQFVNLKTFPQYMWDNIRFQGKIFGVPTPSGRAGNLPYYRTDWAKTLGMEGFSGPEGTRAYFAAVTANDPNGNGSGDTWGQGRYSSGWNVFDNVHGTQSFRVPNGWRLNDDGTLTAAHETDEFRQMVEHQVAIFQDGGFHPDAPSMTFSDAQNAFIAGATGLHSEGLTSFFGTGSVGDRLVRATPGATIGPLLPVGPDGQPGVTYNGSGSFGYVAIPSSVGGDEERVLELLRILDYLAAPFGSEEQRFLGSGIEGIHYELSPEGAPIVNDTGRAERSDLVYFMGGLQVLFYADNPPLGLQVQEDLKASAALGIDNPTLVLFSQANVDNGPLLSQLGMDAITAIVTGRQGIDTLPDVIEQWKSQGGEQIRTEFQEALQQQG